MSVLFFEKQGVIGASACVSAQPTDCDLLPPLLQTAEDLFIAAGTHLQKILQRRKIISAARRCQTLRIDRSGRVSLSVLSILPFVRLKTKLYLRIILRF